jgi:hypothetical protein
MAAETESSRGPQSAPGLPKSSVEDAVRVVRAVDELAGPSSRPRLAQQMGMTPANSKFKTHVASASFMGLVERGDGQKVQLTPRGADAISSDNERAAAALQEAVAAPYTGLLARLMGRTSDAATVSARLQEDHGVDAKAAERLAGLLVASAEHSGLIRDNRWDVEAIEGTLERVKLQESSTNEESSSANRRTPRKVSKPKAQPPAPPAPQPDIRDAKDPKAAGKVPPVPPAQAPGPFGINVTVNLDLATVPPEQALAFLRKLKEQMGPEAS